MSEEDHPSRRLQNLVRLSILFMMIWLIFGFFTIEVRIDWYFYPEFRLNSITLFSCTGAYRLVGSYLGYRSLPSYALVQNGIFPTSSQVFFLVAFIGHHLGLTERKTAVRFGIISLIPCTVILVVNLFGIFVPGSTSIVAPIPFLVISILGLVILRLTAPKPTKDEWLPE